MVKMFEGKGLANCPVAVVKVYLSHLNPNGEALFQKPLIDAKFKPSSDVIWYSTLPLGHNTIDSMMKNMCLRAGIDPPFTNHCVRSTTVNFCLLKIWKIATSEQSRATKAMQVWNPTTIVQRSSSSRICLRRLQISSTSADLTIKSPLTR